MKRVVLINSKSPFSYLNKTLLRQSLRKFYSGYIKCNRPIYSRQKKRAFSYLNQTQLRQTLRKFLDNFRPRPTRQPRTCPYHSYQLVFIPISIHFQIVEHFILVMGEKDIDEESRYHKVKMGGDTLNCKWCETKIGLTDVEGHYSGICKTCRDHDANQW